MATLFIDADDTLWENNVYFEAVVSHYCRLMEACGVEADTARQCLLQIERVRTKTSGYGIASFNRSIREACLDLAGGAAEAVIPELDEHCAGISRQPMAVLADVPGTLESLAARHTLILLTKGDTGDQRSKVERSGLAHWFTAVDIVREKDEAAYRAAAARHRVDRPWMVGNSPRSDVLPALAAGWGAVFIPHPATWVLELEPLPHDLPEEVFLRLDAFIDLLHHF